MIYVYQADTEKYRKEFILEDLLQELPHNMHKRALRYKFEQDAYNFVVGKLLLKRALENLGMKDQIESIAYQKNEKPFLENIFFNISHSYNLVVCAITQAGNIGIDVEKEKSKNLKNFESYFTIIEWKEIMKAASPIQKFYWYWTRKESIIKALGVNLSYLHEIEVDSTKNLFIENDKKWYLQDLKLNKPFIGAICSEVVIDEVIYL